MNVKSNQHLEPRRRDGGGRRAVTLQDLADLYSDCYSDPSDRFVELVRRELAPEFRDQPASIVRAAIVSPAGEEPDELPFEVIVLSIRSVFAHPENGFGDLAREHFGVDELTLTDHAISLFYRRNMEEAVEMRDRMKDAFLRLDGDTIRFFLSRTRENWLRAESDLSRSVAVALVLLVVFELLHRAAVDRFVFFGLEIEDLTLPVKILPVAVAYLCLKASLAVWSVLQLERAYSAAVEENFPDLFSRDLEIVLGVGQTSVWHTHAWLTLVNSASRSRRYLSSSSSVVLPVSVLLLVAILGYMYVRIFGRFGITDPLALMSLLASTWFVTLIVAFWSSIMSDETPATD